jgi:hypothetical protein
MNPHRPVVRFDREESGGVCKPETRVARDSMTKSHATYPIYLLSLACFPACIVLTPWPMPSGVTIRGEDLDRHAWLAVARENCDVADAATMWAPWTESTAPICRPRIALHPRRGTAQDDQGQDARFDGLACARLGQLIVADIGKGSSRQVNAGL